MKQIGVKVIAFFLGIVMLFPTIVSAGTATPGLPLRIEINGEKVTKFSSEPFFDENDVVFVPLSFLADTLHMRVEQSGNEIIIIYDRKKLEFKSGETSYRINEKAGQFKTASVVKEETLFTPLQGICEAFGITYKWDGLVNTSYLIWNGEPDPDVILPGPTPVSSEVSLQQSQLNGNLANFGSVASTEKYHFYVKQSIKQSVLYRYDLKTKQTKQITSGESIYNLVPYGEWLYFLGDNPGSGSHDAYSLYKIKMDGTKKSIVGKKNDLARVFVIDKGWIYFGNWKDQQRLYKMKLDGSGLKKLGDVSLDYLQIRGDWLIAADSNVVYIYTTAGQKVAEFYLRGRNMTVVGDNLRMSGFSGEITTIPLKAGSLLQDTLKIKSADVLAQVNEIDIEVINYKNNIAYMYFRGTSHIYKMALDDEPKPVPFVTIPKSGSVQEIHIVGNYMYYTVIYTKDGHRIIKRELYRVSLGGQVKPEKLYTVNQ